MSVSIPSSETQCTSAVHQTLTPVAESIKDGNLSSIARAITEHEPLSELIFKLYVQKVSQECGSLCSKSQEPSPFRKIPIQQLVTLEWTLLMSHLSTKCPHLYSLFAAIVSHSDHRNKDKRESSHHPGICMAIAILLKERNREMCGVQSLVSVLMYNSHVQKQVRI